MALRDDISTLGREYRKHISREYGCWNKTEVIGEISARAGRADPRPTDPIATGNRADPRPDLLSRHFKGNSLFSLHQYLHSMASEHIKQRLSQWYCNVMPWETFQLLIKSEVSKLGRLYGKHVAIKMASFLVCLKILAPSSSLFVLLDISSWSTWFESLFKYWFTWL